MGGLWVPFPLARGGVADKLIFSFLLVYDEADGDELEVGEGAGKLLLASLSDNKAHASHS